MMPSAWPLQQRAGWSAFVPSRLAPARRHVSFASMSAATAQDWESFFGVWDKVFVAAADWTELTEGTVALSFAGKLLELLDWEGVVSPAEVTFALRVGHDKKPVRADIVLAPTREDAIAPGKVYAVIELKRPGLGDSESARLQARCYADHLRAPVYAVIDGQCIRVWHRRLVDEDLPELDLPRSEFQARFGEVRTLLGRTALEELHADLKRSPDEVKDARARVAKIDHTVPVVRLCIEGGSVWSSWTRAEVLDGDRWWGPHTSKGGRLRLSVAGAFDDWIRSSEELVFALARIAVHAETLTLAVDDPDRWNRELDNVSLHLQEHHAAAATPHAEARLDGRAADNDLGAPDALAAEIHTALDAWARAAVTHRIRSILSGKGSAPHWGHGDVPTKLATPWSIDEVWLKSALRASASDRAHAARRLGRRTIPYLVDAALFSMAVAEVLPNLQPGANPGFPHNLDSKIGGATEGIGFAYAMARVEDLCGEPFLLILSCSSLTATYVPRRRIGSPPPPRVKTAWRIGERNEHRIVCALSDDARAILTDGGWTRFEEHLIHTIRAQHALQDEEGVPCPSPPPLPSAEQSPSAGTEAAAS